MKKHGKVHKLMSVLIAAIMIVGMAPAVTAAASAAENFKIDWDKETKMGGSGELQQWSVVKNNEGYYVYMELPPEKAETINIEYDDTSKNQSSNCSINYTNYGWQGPHLSNSWNGAIEGASITVKTDDAKQYAECFIPNSYFSGSDFTLKCGGSTINSANIKNIDGSSEESTEPTTEPTESTTEPTQAAYEDIIIDGKFDDWEAVPKYDVDEGKGWHTVDQMAMVWDGDWVYLYLMTESSNYDAITGIGDWNNGQYAITTDLGRVIYIQPRKDLTVGGVDDAIVKVSAADGSPVTGENNKHYGKHPFKWEIAIPASILVDKDTGLDKYKETISFGIYLKEPTITGVANIESNTGNKEFEKIEYDGSYNDWAYYPHTAIEYSTQGSHEHVVDGEAALYADGETLYGHVVTEMPQHLAEKGGEFTQAVTIKINDNEKLEFAPRFIAVDENGNINWNPTLSGLQNGTYEFYIVSLDAEGKSENINNITNEKDTIYGKMTVTIKDGRDECEWQMDIPKLAKHLRPNVEGTVITEIDPSDIKTISARYGRIGDEWVTTAGASTGPIAGIILCLGVVGGVLLYRKKRLGKKAA